MTQRTGLPPTVNADEIEIPRHTAVNLIAFAETITEGDKLRVFGQKPLIVKDVQWINRDPNVVIAFNDLASYRGLQLRFVVTDNHGYGGVLRWTGEQDVAWKARVEDEVLRAYSVEARVTGAREPQRPSAAKANIQTDNVNTTKIGRP